MSDNDRSLVFRAVEESRAYAEELADKQIIDLRTKIEETGVKVIEPDLASFIEDTQSV